MQDDDDASIVSRRALLKSIGVLGAGLALAEIAGCSSSSSSKSSTTTPGAPATTTAPGTVTTVKPAVIRKPGSRPNPTLPEGTDMLPKIEHIVVLQMENHSFDDHFGMLGRGDGFKLDSSGAPLDANPDPRGGYVRAFHMPSTCQLSSVPGQDWFRSHTSWNNGRNDGFVRASTAVAMGYWDDTDIPFYYSLAKSFPVCDRFFCSVLAQTYPNRRFLLAGTAAGIVSTSGAALSAPAPPNGTIMDRLHAHDIPWKNYYSDLPGTAVITETLAKYPKNIVKVDQFFADAKAGTLPAVSWVDPNFDHRIRGERRRHSCRRRFRRVGDQRRVAKPQLVEDRTRLQLRRAWRVLRPRCATSGDQARQHRAGRRREGHHGRVRPLRIPSARR